jgi:hypothetical protein
MKLPVRLQSLRARLTAWYTLLLLSTMVVFGALSYYYTSNTLAENLDRSLTNEVRWVRDFIEPQVSKVKPGRRTIDAILRRTMEAAKPDTARHDSVGEADEIWNQIFRHTLQSPK